MNDEDEVLQKMVKEYCGYFYRISTTSIFKSGTSMEFHVVEFDLGIILKILMQVKENHKPEDITPTVIHFLRVTSPKMAFKKLQLNLSDYLSELQEKALLEASKNKVPYFKGTTRFYGPTMDEIYYIKEKREKFWNIRAAQKDLDNFMKDSFNAS